METRGLSLASIFYALAFGRETPRVNMNEHSCLECALQNFNAHKLKAYSGYER